MTIVMSDIKILIIKRIKRKKKRVSTGSCHDRHITVDLEPEALCEVYLHVIARTGRVWRIRRRVTACGLKDLPSGTGTMRTGGRGGMARSGPGLGKGQRRKGNHCDKSRKHDARFAVITADYLQMFQQIGGWEGIF
jgi:hypothetical protein